MTLIYTVVVHVFVCHVFSPRDSTIYILQATFLVSSIFSAADSWPMTAGQL